MRLQAGVILTAALLCAGLAPLRATTITSYTFSDWNASLVAGSANDANFTHIQYTSYGPSGYTTTDGFTITGPDGAGTSLQGVSYQGYSSLKGGSDSSAQVQVATPSAGETGLLFLLGSSPSTANYYVTLSDGEQWTLPGSTTIFGLSISHPITMATLSATPGSSLVLEDVSYGNTNLTLDSSGGSGGGSTPPVGGGGPSAVPEATTMFLLGSGLLMVALARKRASVH